MNRDPEEYAPRSLVEMLRYRIDRHGQEMRELTAYVDSLQPEVMADRQRTMQKQLEELKIQKADKAQIEGLEKKVDHMADVFNRLLIGVILGCITVTLGVLAAAGKL